MITPGSRRKVWWLCNQCPDGQRHRWLAAVCKRSYGSGCPYCSGRKGYKHNSLATIAPQAAARWDFAKNSRTPDDVTAFSSSMAHWCCFICGHGWEARIDKAAMYNSGCAQCNAGGVPKADGSKPQTKHPTYEQCQHLFCQSGIMSQCRRGHPAQQHHTAEREESSLAVPPVPCWSTT